VKYSGRIQVVGISVSITGGEGLFFQLCKYGIFLVYKCMILFC
jgi:hypothetical protein